MHRGHHLVEASVLVVGHGRERRSRGRAPDDGGERPAQERLRIQGARDQVEAPVEEQRSALDGGRGLPEPGHVVARHRVVAVQTRRDDEGGSLGHPPADRLGRLGAAPAAREAHRDDVRAGVPVRREALRTRVGKSGIEEQEPLEVPKRLALHGWKTVALEEREAPLDPLRRRRRAVALEPHGEPREERVIRHVSAHVPPLRPPDPRQHTPTAHGGRGGQRAPARDPRSRAVREPDIDVATDRSVQPLSPGPRARPVCVATSVAWSRARPSR